MVGRMLLAWSLLVVGVAVAFVSILAVYVRSTAIDPGQARSLARRLIEQPDVRAEVATASVDQLYASVAGAPAILRPEAVGTVTAALQTAPIQNLWVESIASAHSQLVDALENRNTGSASVVVLNLRPFVVRASSRVGLGPALAQRLPPGVGKIVILPPIS